MQGFGVLGKGHGLALKFNRRFRVQDVYGVWYYHFDYKVVWPMSLRQLHLGWFQFLELRQHVYTQCCPFHTSSGLAVLSSNGYRDCGLICLVLFAMLHGLMRANHPPEVDPYQLCHGLALFRHYCRQLSPIRLSIRSMLDRQECACCW